MPKLNTLTAIATTLVVIGLVLGIGYLVYQEFQESIGTDSVLVNNETQNVTSGGINVNANYTSRDCYSTFAVTFATNASGDTIESTNYTIEPTKGRIVPVSTSGFIGDNWNITYSYLNDADNSTACDAIASTANATDNVTTWLSIIVILLIAGLLIALVFKYIVGEVEGQGNTAEI